MKIITAHQDTATTLIRRIAAGELFCLPLWCSYVSARAPSNASGSCVGYGRTKEEASAAAAHWNNQAPFERLRRLTVIDQSSPRSGDRDSAAAARAILPDDVEVEMLADDLRAPAKIAHQLYSEGRYASAIFVWLDGIDLHKVAQ